MPVVRGTTAAPLAFFGRRAILAPQEDSGTMPNPVLNDKTFEKAAADAGWAAPGSDQRTAASPIGPITDGPSSPYVAYAPEGGVMTRAGAYTATGVLLAILFIGGFVGWFTVVGEPRRRGDDLPRLAAAAAVRRRRPRVRQRPSSRSWPASSAPIYAVRLRRRARGHLATSTDAQWSGIVVRPSASPPPSP